MRLAEGSRQTSLIANPNRQGYDIRRGEKTEVSILTPSEVEKFISRDLKSPNDISPSTTTLTRQHPLVESPTFGIRPSLHSFGQWLAMERRYDELSRLRLTRVLDVLKMPLKTRTFGIADLDMLVKSRLKDGKWVLCSLDHQGHNYVS